MAAPKDHYALVGPLWAELEQALHESEVEGETVDEKINSLRSRLSSEVISGLHYVRKERNALVHREAKPLANPSEWEDICRKSITEVRGRQSSNNATPPLFKIAAWCVGIYIVLHNDKLLELLATGALCYGAYKLFFSSKHK